MFLNVNKNMRGFTLIETLVAITILIVGVIGPLTIAARGIADGFFARNQIAANYLAQEAAEVILNRRLSNSIISQGFAAPSWQGLSDCFASDETICVVDASYNSGAEPIQSVGLACEGNECSLVFDKQVGYFHKPTEDDEPVGPVFQRTIKMEKIGGTPEEPDEVRVTVTVSWLNLAMPRSLALVENLYRHYLDTGP